MYGPFAWRPGDIDVEPVIEPSSRLAEELRPPYNDFVCDDAVARRLRLAEPSAGLNIGRDEGSEPVEARCR